MSEPRVTTESARISLTEQDARFAVRDLRFLADLAVPTTADHARATLSARWLADKIERATPSATGGGELDA